MDRWQNRVAVVTGASSGIGAAVVTDLIKAGLIVVALARREDRLHQNQQALPVNLQAKYHAVKCDVTNEAEVKKVFSWIDEKLGGTDILVNNAGIRRHGENLTKPDNGQATREVIDTNIMAVVYCVREAFQSMKRRSFDGHIIIVNSVLGHIVPVVPMYDIYCPTKHAVTAMVETYRQEFANAGTKIKLTSLSPGIVETEFFPHLQQLKEKKVAMLNPEDLSAGVIYVLGTPPHVQVHELTIKPMGQIW